MDSRFTLTVAVTAALGFAMGLVALVMGCVLLHLHNSFVVAADLLQYGQSEGWAWCQIERDGLDYNVYCGPETEEADESR